MSHEFIAHCDLEKQPSPDKIGEKLCQTNRYLVVRSSQTDIAMRFSGKELRTHWPEDFTVYVSNKGLTLAIHSATGQERKSIIHDVESALRELGAEIKFEEL